MNTESIHSPENREKIMKAMLDHVPFDGWTHKALGEAVRDAGFSGDAAWRAFDGNPRAVLDFFQEWCDQRMEEELMRMDLASMGIRQKVSAAVLLRLQVMEPWREAMRKTLSWLCFPPRVPVGGKYIYRTVDTIWYAVGDTSTRFDFYTRRATLAAVWGPTLLKWLQDDSPEYTQTRIFLERCLDRVMLVPKVRRNVAKVTRFLASTVCRKSARSD